MKKIKFISLLIMALGMSFTSCEKDEPKDDTKAPVEEADFDIFEEISYDEMVFVKGGTFTMGATEEQIPEAPKDDEFPAHEVTVGDFYIGKYEVTQELWEYVMGYNPSFSQMAKHPVVSISLMDCVDFVANLNSLTGKHFDIPTEAEWEYAARGGNKSNGYKYSGSNTIGDVAWYLNNAYEVGSSSPDYGTHQVGTKAPNELGLYDMSGNVYEWCSDWYSSSYYSSSPSTNPTGPTSGSIRVYRGGGWGSNANRCRVSNRGNGNSDRRGNYLGFRLVMP